MKEKPSNQPVNLEVIDPGPYEIVSNTFDIRKDLHIFVQYIRNRFVKRSVRENNIPKDHARRIARLLSDPGAAAEANNSGESRWLGLIDALALKLDFVHYNTEGEYLGYTSFVKSYPDNYMDFNPKMYNQFLSLSFQKQEETLFETINGDYKSSRNEFLTPSFFGRLEVFNHYGYGAGVMPMIKFDQARKFLFKLLASCDPGVWYSVSSLVSYLKTAHPYFLIPRSPQYQYKGEEKYGRYGNFKEGESPRDYSIRIPENASDGFERVEGRYVERFLEYIPFMLGYMDLAYGEPVA